MEQRDDILRHFEEQTEMKVLMLRMTDHPSITVETLFVDKVKEIVKKYEHKDSTELIILASQMMIERMQKKPPEEVVGGEITGPKGLNIIDAEGVSIISPEVVEELASEKDGS